MENELMIKQFSINDTESEIVDSVADVIELSDRIEDQLEDGWTWDDVVVIIPTVTAGRELMQDYILIMRYLQCSTAT